MSYILELDARLDSWETAERLADVTGGREFVSLLPTRRRRWLRDLPPRVYFDNREADEVLADEASGADHAFAFSPRWVGDRLRQELRITAADLADLVRNSALDRWVRYRVIAG